MVTRFPLVMPPFRSLFISSLQRRRPSVQSSWRRFLSENQKSRTSTSHATAEKTANTASPIVEDSELWIGTHVWRLVCAFGIVYATTEYVTELTICEGPSMLPTIRSKGEIVLLDRFTPRWYGLQGGCNGEQRARLAREKQKWHEEQLALHSKSNSKEEVTWHEPMIQVNKLPNSGAWERFRNVVSTGVNVGDVIVVQHPDRVGTVCKRVLGLPGDMVTKPSMRAMKHGRRLRRRRSGMVVVPDGHIWLEGDNPWNSSDSRNYGPVPASLIVGRVLLRVWPLRGNALMERGARPSGDGSEQTQLTFSGSIVLPAGYDNQVIIRELDLMDGNGKHDSSV